MSLDSHFHQNPESVEYDVTDQTRNIILMHRIVHEIRKQDRELEKSMRKDQMEARKKRRQQLRLALEQSKKALKELLKKQKEAYVKQKTQCKHSQEPIIPPKPDGGFKEPKFLSFFLKIFRGVKYSIKNIHIRFEDDYFCPKNPFSAGISIRNINLETDFEQEKIERQQNLSSIVKMQEIKDVSIYWNSKSEMIVPNTIWESSDHSKFGVFEVIDADTIQSLMKDIFTREFGMNNTYVVNPFTYRMQISLRSEYANMKDEYKYRISMWLQKVQVNIMPRMFIDFLGFRQHLEMQSYVRDL